MSCQESSCNFLQQSFSQTGVCNSGTNTTGRKEQEPCGKEKMLVRPVHIITSFFNYLLLKLVPQ